MQTPEGGQNVLSLSNDVNRVSFANRRPSHFELAASKLIGDTVTILPVRNSSPRRALIVIDVQNDYVGGELAIQSPPIRDSVENVARAMDVATAAGVKVVVVKQLAPESSPIFANGSRGGEIHAGIARRPHDHYVENLPPSAFTATTLSSGCARMRSIQ